MQTSTHISPCLPTKHNTSFSCFFLKTIVDCCGYTLSLSLSTTTILNVPLISFQAKGFCFLMCFHEKHCNPVRNLRSPHAPVTTSFPVSFTIRCSHAPPPPGKNPSDIRQTDGQTDRQTLTPHAGIVGVAIMTLHHQST